MKEIIKQVIHGKVHVQIGKKGLTTDLINQIDELFRKRRVIKVRFLMFESYDTIDDAVRDLCHKVRARNIDIRGKTCVIIRQKNSNLRTLT